jgi:phage-related protein
MSTSQAVKANDESPAPSPENESGDEGQKRINVTFTPQQYRTLRELATLQGINVSDVLRQAISITKLVVEANQKGKILIEQNGEVQRLKIL